MTDVTSPTPQQLWEEWGRSIFPVRADKRPAWDQLPQAWDEATKRMRGQWGGYQRRKPLADEMRRWIAALTAGGFAGFAQVTGEISNILTADFDGKAGVQLAQQWGVRPHRRTGSGGLHLDVEYPGFFIPTLNGKSKAELGRRWPGLDIKGDGGYCIVLGRNESGPYEWLRDPRPDPTNVIPAEVWEFLRQYSQPNEATVGSAAPPLQNGHGPVVNGSGSHRSNGRVDVERLIRKALDAAPSAGRNNAGFDLACQLRDNDYSESETLAALQNFGSRAAQVNTKGEREQYTNTEMAATVREVFSRPARDPWRPRTLCSHPSGAANGISNGVGNADLQRHAREQGGDSARRPPSGQQGGGEPVPGGQADTPDLLGYLPNDHGNACRLLALYGDDLRYCHAFRKWLVWDGRRWAVDDTDRSRQLAKRAMLEFLRQAVERHSGEQTEKFARGSLDARRISSLLVMAESEAAVRPAELDTDPYLLNFENGTVDLRTGELHAHSREDLITKLVHCDYVSEARCPLWGAFLDQIMGGGPDASEGDLERARRLTDYLQRAFGYSLTACTSEKAVFVPFGEGDNGKSTMLSTFRSIVEEYSALMQVDTLMVRQESNNTQADLADLRGARFVQTSETEEGQRLAQGKIKRITQGMGKIKATRKYENPIEFLETHKLWIDTNRKPTIKDADDKATFSRLHPIPFTVRIAKDEIDKEMPAKLLREAEGIMAWAVQGARLWRESGLKKPREVDAAKDEWRAEMDQIGRFIEERCVTGESFRSSASALYADYKRWAEAGGEQVNTSTAFGVKVTARGYEKRHSDRGAVYFGIALQSESKEDRRADNESD